MQLERVLTKLKFDESVLGYALITNDGHPFLSFSLPDEVLPRIKGTLKIHANDLKLMNVLTDEGSVVLARVDPKWVLAVFFGPELHLGGALSRTQAVVNLLVQVDLPPPPTSVESEVEVIPEEPETVEVQTMDEPTVTTTVDSVPHVEEEEIDIDEVEVFHGCVVLRGKNYNQAMTLDSKLNLAMKRAYSNLGVDILLITDQKMTVYKIAEQLAKPVEKVLDAVRWCISKRIVDVECPDEQETEQKELIEMPLFEGNIDKVKKQHRAVLELCDGTRSLQQIATVLGIPYFEALQCTIPYRGKTLHFIRTVKLTRG
jgi:predicted regulator of Ras-like GTPase activity (Roadblock/LC7/MglB family)